MSTELPTSCGCTDIAGFRPPPRCQDPHDDPAFPSLLSPQPAIRQMPLSACIVDPDVQSRQRLDDGVVEEYAAAMAEGVTFPPIVVFADEFGCWVADGFHRVAAAQRAGLDAIAADVRPGSRRDALLFAVGANTSHGLRRTNADKRRP